MVDIEPWGLKKLSKGSINAKSSNIFNVFMTFCYIVISLFLMWGSMRDQGFHEGVDSLKSLPRPDLYLSILIEIHRSPILGVLE